MKKTSMEKVKGLLFLLLTLNEVTITYIYIILIWDMNDKTMFLLNNQLLVIINPMGQHAELCIWNFRSSWKIKDLIPRFQFYTMWWLFSVLSLDYEGSSNPYKHSNQYKIQYLDLTSRVEASIQLTYLRMFIVRTALSKTL